MAKVRELYRSANGDRWSSLRETSELVFIWHEATRASGGRASELDIAAFLNQSGNKPEKQELLDRDTGRSGSADDRQLRTPEFPSAWNGPRPDI